MNEEEAERISAEEERELADELRQAERALLLKRLQAKNRDMLMLLTRRHR